MFLFISHQFADSLPEDPFDGILAIIAAFRRALSVVPESASDTALQERKRYRIAQETCAFLSAYLKREGFAITVPQLAYGYDKPAEEQRDAVAQVIQFVNKLETDITSQKHVGQPEYLQAAASAALGPALPLEFSEKDLRRIWTLLTEFRESIPISRDLEPAQKRRLLQRIDRLVGEFRQKTYDLSLFWGFVVEMSLLFHPRGEDGSVLAPRMKELMEIVWSAQAKAFGIPPHTPLRLLGQDT